MNGTAERNYSRVSGRAGYKELRLRCPCCNARMQGSGDSLNWGSVRKHMNLHIARGEMTEQQKVSYVKEMGI